MYKKTGIPEPINIPPMPRKKPPLGLIPRDIWLSERLFDIKEAIKRYLDEDYPIPDKWIEEYNELVNLLEK